MAVSGNCSKQLSADELLPLDSCRPFFRIYWSVESAGGVEQFLKSGATDVTSATLQLEEGEKPLLRMSSLLHISDRHLALIESAASHQQAAACLDVLSALVFRLALNNQALRLVITMPKT